MGKYTVRRPSAAEERSSTVHRPPHWRTDPGSVPLQKELAENALKQLQESEQRCITYAQRVLELQEAMQKASDAMKSCHTTNVQLSDDKKVRFRGRASPVFLRHGITCPTLTGPPCRN